jgi:hypothetical protein
VSTNGELTWTWHVVHDVGAWLGVGVSASGCVYPNGVWSVAAVLERGEPVYCKDGHALTVEAGMQAAEQALCALRVRKCLRRKENA